MLSGESRLGGKQIRLSDFQFGNNMGGDYSVIFAEAKDYTGKHIKNFEFRFSSYVVAQWRNYEDSNLTPENTLPTLTSLVLQLAQIIDFPRYDTHLEDSPYRVSFLTKGTPGSATLYHTEESYYVCSDGSMSDLVKELVHGNQYSDDTIRREIVKYLYDAHFKSDQVFVETDELISQLFLPATKAKELIKVMVALGKLEGITPVGTTMPKLVRLLDLGLFDESLNKFGGSVTIIGNQVNNNVNGDNNSLNTVIIQQTNTKLDELERLVNSNLKGSERSEAKGHLDVVKEAVNKGDQATAISTLGKFTQYAKLGLDGARIVADLILLASSSSI